MSLTLCCPSLLSADAVSVSIVRLNCGGAVEWEDQLTVYVVPVDAAHKTLVGFLVVILRLWALGGLEYVPMRHHLAHVIERHVCARL